VGVMLPTSDLRLGHALALRRVLLNLTTNALKFTERGSVDIVAAEQSPTRITFTVRDTGPGINPEALSSLYHPFRRSAKAGRYLFSGTGLGLALTRRLVRAMGSELCLETRPGRGTGACPRGAAGGGDGFLVRRGVTPRRSYLTPRLALGFGRSKNSSMARA